jgi:HD-GYP domain-containing protein (c-di-GMP phosphodiesterase class II)
MPNEQKKFQQIIDMSLDFAQAKDMDLLLEKILGAARKFVNAEAGSIYIEDGDKLQYHHTQNKTLQNQSAPGEKRIYQSSLAPAEPDSIAAYVAKTGKIVNIADVQQLPEDTPYSLEHSYLSESHHQVKAVLAFPLKNLKEKAIGVVQLSNPQNETGEIGPISEDEMPLIRLFANNAANAIERARSTRARIMGIIQVLTTLRNTEETVAHFNRLGAYSAKIFEVWARKKKIPQAEIESQKDTLRMAAMLHDIGKLAIPNIIRRKPGRLTDEEYETMKQHTLKGAQLLLKYAQSETEKIAAEIALNHHERWDGAGYPGHVDPETGQVLPGYEDERGKPRGKKGEEIPVFGRIVAIADVYESLLSRRVYRNAWKEADVLEQLRKGTGTQFDPEIIDAFFSSLDTIHAIAQRYPD